MKVIFLKNASNKTLDISLTVGLLLFIFFKQILWIVVETVALFTEVIIPFIETLWGFVEILVSGWWDVLLLVCVAHGREVTFILISIYFLLRPALRKAFQKP